jgi:cellulose synthase/poly-beta-1,6-N-acetylglucosamine synthase-like glycosyltransferase
MLVEILQWYELLFGRNHSLGWLALFFVFVMFYVSIMRIESRGYKPQLSNDLDGQNRNLVSAVVPFYNEEARLLVESIQSIRRQNVKEIIAVTDNPSDPAISTVRRLVDRLIVFGRRRGKRYCLATGVEKTSGEFILFVDSDTILTDGCVQEMLRAFSPTVGGVSTRHLIHDGDKESLHGAYSSIIEDNRWTMDRAFSKFGALTVLDGRCSMYRREAIVPYITSDTYLKERANGHIFITGDDMQLTRHLNNVGWKTRVSGGVAYTSAPSSLTNFLKQQLRWLRSGYHYHLADIRERFRGTSALYAFAQLTYFLTPGIFIAVILHDILLVPPPDGIIIPPVYALLVAVVGSSLVSAAQQMILRSKVTLRYFFQVGFLGLLILLPLSIYAFFTRKRQHLWLTR